MESDKQQELAQLLREAAEIVDNGLGVLGSSLAKDHILCHLADFMIGDRIARWNKTLPLRPPGLTPEEREAEEKGVADWEAHERALGLTEVVVRQAGKLVPFEVWTAYEFFLKRSRALGRGRKPAGRLHKSPEQRERRGDRIGPGGGLCT